MCYYDYKMFKSPLHLVLIYKYVFFFDQNWIVSI